MICGGDKIVSIATMSVLYYKITRLIVVIISQTKHTHTHICTLRIYVVVLGLDIT